MADFVDSEAEVDSSDGDDGGRSPMSDENEDEEVVVKKEKKSTKRKHSDDDDDEEEGEELDGDLDDLIDDNPVEEDGPDEVDSGDEEGDDAGAEKKHRHSDYEEDLEDEDYDLLEENLGIKVKRKQKRKRIRIVSDDEDSDQDGEREEGRDRETIAKEIFDRGDDEDERPPVQEEPAAKDAQQEFGDIDISEAEESDVDDFIVDDDGQPISKTKKKKHIIHDDAALQEAQDIFGVDFDYAEFEDYVEEDDEEEEEYEEEEEDEEGEPRPRARKSTKRKSKRTTIYEVFEPSELERGHFTDQDQEIRAADMPERFQLRTIPVCALEEGEAELEAAWIHKHAFLAPGDPATADRRYGGTAAAPAPAPNSSEKVGKIKQALKCMRNQQFEVPFIAFYRKEYVEPELNINDLWKVYQWDEKWMQLRMRRQNLVTLFVKMQQYQFTQVDNDDPIPVGFRTLTEEDIERTRAVQTMEELRDVYQHFLLYYGVDIPKMKQMFRLKKQREEEAEEGRDPDAAAAAAAIMGDALKLASRKTGYSICAQAGLAEVVMKFGLTPEQFGENLRDNYQRHEVEQDAAEPFELAENYMKGQFATPDDVMKGARHMVAMQIANDPVVRQCVRQVFYERAQISCEPTKKGTIQIDEAHPYYTFQYLKNKPVQELQDDQFLKITMGADDGLLSYELYLDIKDNNRTQSYFEEIKQLYHRDEFSNLVQEWNNQRSQALERALQLILYPQMVKELHSRLLDEAKEFVIKACCRKLYTWLKVAPYQVDQQLDDDDDDYDSSRGVRIMGLAYSSERDGASFCCVIDGDGDVIDYMRLVHLMTRKYHRADSVADKAAEMEKLKDFISNKKPHVIAIGGDNRDGMMVMEDLKELMTELEQEQQSAPVSVELVENELAIIYANSKKAEHDFREYPTLLRQAVSLARRLQDSLVEFAQLCNADEDILSLKYHPLQDAVEKEALLDALYLEFVNRVNEVGVDVNKCVLHPQIAPLVQFVCGLGPRKGHHLLKILKQHSSRLENRTQLVTLGHMGPKVFFNCAGFIKIDTTALGDSTEAYVEVLDGSRVHPETYEWARKMAVDALEYDDTAEDANPAGALEEILESPDRLKDLDLDAFAEELERQGYGNKHITLYDIRAELNHRYKDLRTPYRSATVEERFSMLTKESPHTFHIGKMVMCRVTGFARKKPRREALDQADPVRNDETGLWQCPFCQKNDFPELSEVWTHFDAQECAGESVGVKTRLDNGIAGFIPLRTLSDKHVDNPEDRVKIGMPLHCRITKIDIERFQVELSCKTSDLVDKENKWKLQKDHFYDFDQAELDKKISEDKKKLQSRQTYVKRVIVHPSFHNIDYKTCEKLMRTMEQGEVVMRPSSKGTDHLTATWKVSEGVLQHIDIREEGKENPFSLGQILVIDKDEFEDLDEIIARHIQPMAAFARDLLNYKYFKDLESDNREAADKVLLEEKRSTPARIPYYVSSSKLYPGKFMLSYLPRKTPKHEYVTVTPDGLRYRGQVFRSLGSLVRWFKEHFRDRVAGTPAIARTPMGMTGNINATPRVAATPGRGTPFQVTAGTPYLRASGTPFGYGYQPVATPVMTPIMTPSYAPPAITTPMVGTPIATPLHMTTPIAPMATPMYAPPPSSRAAWSQAAAAMTPRQTPSQTPTQTPTQTSAAAAAAAAAMPFRVQTSQDWAKMAEMWAKQKQVERGGSKRGGAPRTPRPGQSPGPAPVASPIGGGGTPLFDER